MSWQVLRPQIVSVLNGIATIAEVSDTPKLRFTSFPSAYVVPATTSGDYETSRENIRTYAFIVRLFYETKQTGVSTAIGALEKVVDSVIDAFDEEDLKTTDRVLGKNLPAKYTFINIWATPSNWLELPDEQLIMSEILVKIRVSVDIS